MSNTESDKNTAELYDMVVRGKDYREEKDFEYLGTETTAVLRPLKDAEFLPIAAKLQAKFNMDEVDAVEEIEDAKDEDGGINVGDMDEEFVELIQLAAKRGVVGDDMGLSEEQVEEMIEGMVGGFSVELGGEVLELSGNIRDAEKFR